VPISVAQTLPVPTLRLGFAERVYDIERSSTLTLTGGNFTRRPS
jgi:hypothetical protein